MSRVGDAVLADGKIYTKQEASQFQKYVWHASDTWATLKELKKYKDFVWIVKNGQCLFYTYEQTNDMIAELETLREVDQSQRVTIAYYQDIVQDLRNKLSQAELHSANALQDQFDKGYISGWDNAEREIKITANADTSKRIQDAYFNGLSEGKAKVHGDVKAAYITALNHAITAIEAIREDELNDSN